MSFKAKRSRKAITMDKLLLVTTDAILECEKIIQTSSKEGARTNAINALSGLVSRYSKLFEVADLEKRIQEIEERLNNKEDE